MTSPPGFNWREDCHRRVRVRRATRHGHRANDEAALRHTIMWIPVSFPRAPPEPRTRFGSVKVSELESSSACDAICVYFSGPTSSAGRPMPDGRQPAPRRCRIHLVE
jgi:hypothetical protein